MVLLFVKVLIQRNPRKVLLLQAQPIHQGFAFLSASKATFRTSRGSFLSDLSPLDSPRLPPDQLLKYVRHKLELKQPSNLIQNPQLNLTEEDHKTL